MIVVVVVVLKVHEVNQEQSSKKSSFYLKFPRFMNVQLHFTHIFTFTSRSRGKLIPKLSASVNISEASPVHCLVILPTWNSSSKLHFKTWKGSLTVSPVWTLSTLNSTSLPQQLHVQHGPSILSTGLPSSSLIRSLKHGREEGAETRNQGY